MDIISVKRLGFALGTSSAVLYLGLRLCDDNRAARDRGQVF